MAAATRAPSQRKRAAKTDDEDGVSEFMSSSKNHKSDEAFNNRLNTMKTKATATVKQEAQNACENHLYTNEIDTSMCGQQRIIIVFSRNEDGERENHMLKWQGASMQLSEYLKQEARRKGEHDPKGLGKFGAIYGGAEQGPGAYRSVNMKFLPPDLSTILNPYTWYFFSYQGDLTTILKKLLQWFVKAGVPHSVFSHEINTEQVDALAKATLGPVLDIPDVKVTSLVLTFSTYHQAASRRACPAACLRTKSPRSERARTPRRHWAQSTTSPTSTYPLSSRTCPPALKTIPRYPSILPARFYRSTFIAHFKLF
jgi:hypothetical protein